MPLLPRWPSLVLLLLMPLAFLAGLASAQGATPFDGQYVGDLTLTNVISGDCTKPPPASVYPLTIAGGKVRFVFVPRFDTTLIGKVDGKGNLQASARIRHGFIRMTGYIQGDKITAQIESPSCKYTFQATQG
ncbi:MAG TPA: hypothetical protein VNF04_12700 [Stellaceae bacterium]|nr:hypothetical protein [Stellaceae bacterium]